jgi:hypothetical protein
MFKYLWKTSSPEELAQAELQACFYALTAQKETVAQKRQAYDLVREVTEQAKNRMDSSKFLYDSAVQFMGESSKEAADANINHRSRQTEYKMQWQRLADARTALDLAIAEKDKRQAKYDQAQGIKTPDVAQVSEQPKLPGKIVLPEAVVSHFAGNNREHVKTEQSEALREELAQTRSGINFSQMHKKLARTLHFGSGSMPASERILPKTPHDSLSDSSSTSDTSVTLSPLFMRARHFRDTLEGALRRRAQPEPRINDELKAAITARRRQFND